MKFIVILRSHKQLGPYLAPYMADSGPGMEFWAIKQQLLPDSMEKAGTAFSEAQRQIARLAYECSETYFSSTLGSKRHAPREFMKLLSETDISLTIRPAIDRRTAQIVDICVQNGIGIYEKPENINTIFPSDEVSVCPKPMRPVFNFERGNSETRYFLSLKYGSRDIPLFRMQMSVIAQSPCIISTGKRMYRVEGVDAKKLAPFISKEYISAPKSVEAQYYGKFVKNAIASGCEVRARGFSILTSRAEPKPLLGVESGIDGSEIYSLKFRYGDMDFQSSSPGGIAVRLAQEGGEIRFTKTVRDLQYEQAAEEQAALILGGRISKGYYKAPAQGAAPQERRASAIKRLNAQKEKLAEAGIEIELSDDDKKYYAGPAGIQINASSSGSWFSIKATVLLDGMEIPLAALKHYILNSIREFTLPDGRILVLPEEWLCKYRDLLASGIISKKDSTILLRGYQYSALEGLPLEGSVMEKIEKLERDLSEPGRLPACQPQNVKATLRPYQATAFGWLKMMRDNGFGACLADDMGLGKTLCTLSLLSESTAYREGDFQDGLFAFKRKIPSLLIVPKSLIYNWISEAKKFTPQLRILEFTGSGRLDTIKSFQLYDIVIAGYGTLRNDVEHLKDIQFNYIVLDESQYVKNSESKTYQCIMRLECRHRLALTGTPLENSLTDLWSQINFINPGLLGSLQGFKKRFVTPIEKLSSEEASKKLRKLTYPFILRRTKQQVLQDLPELTELTVLCDMTEQQKEIYEKEKSSTRDSIIDYMEKGTFEKSTVMVLQSLTRLRQIACSPALTDDGYCGGSGKTEYIVGLLNNVISQGHKVLVFSSFVKHLELIAQRLRECGTGYTMLTGSTTDREREVRKFSGEATPAFLISIKAGGTGLNLTQADYVFIIDPWWNPAVEDQAIARAHRMGQKNAVMAYRFISKDTVEEKIQDLQRKKADLAQGFVQGHGDFPASLREDVLKMLE